MAGILQALLMITSAITEVVNATNFGSITGTFNTTDIQGYTVHPNNNCKVTKVTVSASVSPVIAQIRNHSTHAVLATATFSGQVATFSGAGYSLTSGTDVDIVISNSGSTWGSCYHDPNNLPANNTDLNFTQITYYNGSWTSLTPPTGSPIGGILSVTTTA